MLPIIIATSNRHKFAELKALLTMPGIGWRSLAEFPGLPPVRETGRTFEANAIKKARHVARWTGCFALADDSGLEVDVLGGLPGVRSARFAGRHGDDQANNAILLRHLAPIPLRERRARYYCVLALVSPKGWVGTTWGLWEGRIALKPSGHRGFGYDPLFLVPRFGKTVGQLPHRVKQRLSHRAKAARELRPLLRRFVTIPHGV